MEGWVVRSNGCIASGAADDCIRIFGEQWRVIVEKAAGHSGDVNSVRWHTTVGDGMKGRGYEEGILSKCQAKGR